MSRNLRAAFLGSSIALLLAVGWIAIVLVLPGGEKPQPTSEVNRDVQGPRAPISSERLQAPREELTWNVWAEPAWIRTFRPLTMLRPGETHRIVVDLSGLDYRNVGVTSTVVSRDFKKKVDEWIRLGAPEVDLKIVLLHDPERFERVGKPVQTLKVNVTRIESSPPGSFNVTDAFDAMREATASNNRPPFVYGRVEFAVTARSGEGPATVAFSVWVDGRPVEEFSFQTCVASTEDIIRTKCQGRSAMVYTLRGVDSVRLAAEGGSLPNGALHFIQMYKSGMRHGEIMGVFWRKLAEREQFVTWRLDQTPEALADYLGKTVMPQFFQSGSPEALQDAGRGLYNTLFPANPAWSDAAEARKAFEEFMKGYPPIKTPTLANPAPSVFVRTVLPSLQSDLLMPLALLNVNGRYVGDSMRVQLPLPVQSYRDASTCVSRWVMTLPEQGNGVPLDEALSVVASRVDGWKNDTIEMYRDIASVRKWLSEPKTDTEPSAFIITSHHNQQSLFFKTTDPLIPSEIERTFAPSSIAILNGCGTGEPGAIDIINQLSERNVDAVIATATTVQGRMAGAFLACLADTVKKAGQSAVTLGQLHFVTVRCLADQKGKDDATAYGARALAYMLIGNGNLWLCSPRKGA